MRFKHTVSLCMRCFLALALFFNSFLALGANKVYAQNLNVPNETVLRGLVIDPKNPLYLEFVVDGSVNAIVSKSEIGEIVEFFLAGITVPEEDLWVNLSPHERDRIMPEVLGVTKLGENMLQQDYVLKQRASALTNPNTDLGAKFWQKTISDGNSSLNTLMSKIWILPDTAKISENDKNNTVLIVDSKLKLAYPEELESTEYKDSIKKTLFPALENEINNHEGFAPLRKVYNSLILAKWFRNKVKNLLYQNYVSQNKIKGIELLDKKMKEKIWQKYCDAFKIGTYNVVKKVKQDGRLVKRSFFCGGERFDGIALESSSVKVNTEGFKKIPVSLKPIYSNSSFYEDKESSSIIELVKNANYDSAELSNLIRRNPKIFKEAPREGRDIEFYQGLLKAFDHPTWNIGAFPVIAQTLEDDLNTELGKTVLRELLEERFVGLDIEKVLAVYKLDSKAMFEEDASAKYGINILPMLGSLTIAGFVGPSFESKLLELYDNLDYKGSESYLKNQLINRFDKRLAYDYSHMRQREPVAIRESKKYILLAMERLGPIIYPHFTAEKIFELKYFLSDMFGEVRRGSARNLLGYINQGLTLKDGITIESLVADKFSDLDYKNILAAFSYDGWFMAGTIPSYMHKSEFKDFIETYSFDLLVSVVVAVADEYKESSTGAGAVLQVINWQDLPTEQINVLLPLMYKALEQNKWLKAKYGILYALNELSSRVDKDTQTEIFNQIKKELIKTFSQGNLAEINKEMLNTWTGRFFTDTRMRNIVKSLSDQYMQDNITMSFDILNNINKKATKEFIKTELSSSIFSIDNVEDIGGVKLSSFDLQDSGAAKLKFSQSEVDLSGLQGFAYDVWDAVAYSD